MLDQPASGHVVRGVVHDVNNLLAAALGSTQLVLMNPDLSPEDRDHLEQAKRASQRAAELIGRLLGVGRSPASGATRLNLSRAITNILRILQLAAGDDIHLETILDPGLHLVVMDPTEIDRAILNLVLNSRDAMPRGGRLTLQTANVELTEQNSFLGTTLPAGGYVMLAAIDSGCGIAPQVLPHVFDPYFTTKAPGQGSGLGLAAVHAMVEEAGGEITVRSELGKGSAFRVYLPRR